MHNIFVVPHKISWCSIQNWSDSKWHFKNSCANSVFYTTLHATYLLLHSGGRTHMDTSFPTVLHCPNFIQYTHTHTHLGAPLSPHIPTPLQLTTLFSSLLPALVFLVSTPCQWRRARIQYQYQQGWIMERRTFSMHSYVYCTL